MQNITLKINEEAMAIFYNIKKHWNFFEIDIDDFKSALTAMGKTDIIVNPVDELPEEIKYGELYVCDGFYYYRKDDDTLFKITNRLPLKDIYPT